MNPHSLLYVPTELLQHPEGRPGPTGETRERRWALALVAFVVCAGLAAALLPA